MADQFTLDTTPQTETSSTPSVPVAAPAMTVKPEPRRRVESQMQQESLRRAYHTLSFYQRNPQWLADPDTKHAANADLANSSHIIGMNIQLEKLNLDTEGVRVKNSITSGRIKALDAIAPHVPSGNDTAQKLLGEATEMIGTPEFNLSRFSSIVGYLQSNFGNDSGSPDVVIKLQEELRRKKADKNADPAEIKAIENRISRMSANDETKLASKIKEWEAQRDFRYDAMNQQSLVTLQREVRQNIIEKKATLAELQSGKKMDTADAEIVTRGLKSLEDDLAGIESSLSKRSGKSAPAYPAADPTQAPATEPAKPAAANRVRVKGPDGKTGSVPAGTKLPQGWTFE